MFTRIATRRNKNRRLFRRHNPVTSFGIVLLSGSKKDPQALLVRRHETFAFVDYINGRYCDRWKQSDLRLLATAMTQSERERLCANDFETLWRQMWHGYTPARRQYDRAKRRFSRTIPCMRTLLKEETLHLPDELRHPEWQFPKGRRMSIHEMPLECAMREFQEELGEFAVSSFSFICNCEPFYEIFQGTDNIFYRNVYFVAYISESIAVEHARNISHEISEARWATCAEARAILPSHTHAVFREILSAVKFGKPPPDLSIEHVVSQCADATFLSSNRVQLNVI